ncbi:hypothetical protein ANN_03348 [Periplaneta americana]|uniref:Endonuclease/exonuclease/phosphatase domain-containing protein n=1 Tax=Periplaneta americana TaxID=6978 RepID=A0ABQ8TYV8_PERAM|nr:hypothetical protein ANN_03348 [Periplaneta americana]
MKVNNIQVLNVYLPSGTNHLQERESFLSKELPFFLRHRYDRLLIGGDWNCVLHAKDQTGQYNLSPVLANMTQDLQLVDTWELLHEVETFFKSLYSASPTSVTDTDTLLKHVNRHLNLQQQRDLQLPITEEEILMAIETAPKNTAPGPDGLTYQLFPALPVDKAPTQNRRILTYVKEEAAKLETKDDKLFQIPKELKS